MKTIIAVLIGMMVSVSAHAGAQGETKITGAEISSMTAVNIATTVYVAGNLGVGTIRPSEKLDVIGKIKSQGDDSSWTSINGFQLDDTRDIIQGRKWLISNGAADVGSLVFRVSASSTTDPQIAGTTLTTFKSNGDITAGVATSTTTFPGWVDFGRVTISSASGSGIMNPTAVCPAGYNSVAPGTFYCDSANSASLIGLGHDPSGLIGYRVYCAAGKSGNIVEAICERVK